MAEDIDKLARSVDDLVKVLGKSAGTFGRIHSSKAAERDKDGDKDARERNGARKKLFDDFSKNSILNTNKVGKFARELGSMTQSGEDLRHGILGMLSVFGIGAAVFGDLVRGSEKLASTYRDMSKNGLSFSGSMLDMAASAAQAGLPLSEFAEMMKHVSTTAAALNHSYQQTGVSLGSLQSEVRNNLESYGMLGMSLRDIGGLTGDYANTMRLQGHLADMSTVSTGKQISTLARNIADFSDATGVAREQIQQTMFAALTDVAVTSKMWRSNNEGQKQALETSTAFLAAIPGEFGKILPQMLAQSFGYGSTLLADSTKMFYEAGAQDFVGVIDTMKTKVDAGTFSADDAGDTFDQLRKVGDQNEEMLRMQAASGNEAAKKVLAMIAETRGLTREDFVRKQQEGIASKGFTRFILNIESTFDKLSGAFRTGFYDAVAGLEEAFNQLGNSGLIDALTKNLTAMGGALGQVVMEILSPENMRWLGDKVSDLATWMASIPKSWHIVTDWLGYIKNVFDVARPVFTVLFDVLGVIATIAAKVGSALMFMHDQMAKLDKTFADVGTAVAVYFGYKQLQKLFGSLTGKALGVTAPVVDVKAAEVTLHGPMVINGMGGGFGGRGGGGGAGGNLLQAMMEGGLEDKKLGRLGRMRAFATEAMNSKSMLGRFGGRRLGGLINGVERFAPSLLGGGEAAAGAVGAASAASRVAGMGLSLAKGLTKGLGGFVADAVGQYALSKVPDGTRGKKTAQSMLSYGSSGAMIGSFIPGVGTVVGGAIGAAAGAAAANWDDISEFFAGKKDNPATANPNSPTPAGPVNPSQGPEIDALQAKVLELGQERADMAAGPDAGDDEHKRKMADMQAEMRDCMQAMLQIQGKQSDHLRAIERSNKEIAANPP